MAMIKFNPEDKPDLSYEECLNPIFDVQFKGEASIYKRDYALWLKWKIDNRLYERKPMSKMQVVEWLIGYWSILREAKDCMRVEELFGCVHPIFGPIGMRLEYTPKELIKLYNDFTPPTHYIAEFLRCMKYNFGN